jgi:hypothetical protein
MKDFLGIKVMFLVEGYKVEGTVVEDKADRVTVKTADEKLIRIIKSKVQLFVPATEPQQYIPLQLLCCYNKETSCPGVQYVAEGDKLTRAIFAAFMDPCPMKNNTCQCRTRGDIRTIASSTLKSVMCGVLFGDYPDPEAPKK